MSTAEMQLAEFYAARDAEVRAIVVDVRSALEWITARDAELHEREVKLGESLAVVAQVNATTGECLEEFRSIIEDNASDMVDLQTENGKLRRAVEESAVCCRQLREMAEMALALAASKGSRSAGRILATFKASYATAQEATP